MSSPASYTHRAAEAYIVDGAVSGFRSYQIRVGQGAGMDSGSWWQQT